MKKLILLILNSQFLILNSFSQSGDGVINPFWDFYAENNLSAVANGKGKTGIAGKNDLSGILLNPASINIPSKFQVHAAGIYKSDVPWLQPSSIALKEIYPTVFAGFGYRIDKYFQTGIVYLNSSSFLLDIGEVLRTDEFGNEIGRYEAYQKYNTHSFTAPLTFTYNKISPGVNLTYSLYKGTAVYFRRVKSKTHS